MKGGVMRDCGWSQLRLVLGTQEPQRVLHGTHSGFDFHSSKRPHAERQGP